MVTKGERTREDIIREAAALFNQQGYAGSSISDVMRATGLEKGGIYNHFKNKEQLTVEAFDFSFTEASRRLLAYLREAKTPLGQLRQSVTFFEDYHTDPPVRGGCMLLNTSIESDDSNPRLRERARRGMTRWQNLISRIVVRGIEAGEIRPDTDPDALATMIIATQEGAIMMSQLYKDVVHIQRTAQYLLDYIELRVANPE